MHFLLCISTSCTFPFTLFIFSPHHLIHSVTSSVFFHLLTSFIVLSHSFDMYNMAHFSPHRRVCFLFAQSSNFFRCWKPHSFSFVGSFVASNVEFGILESNPSVIGMIEVLEAVVVFCCDYILRWILIWTTYFLCVVSFSWASFASWRMPRENTCRNSGHRMRISLPG